MAGAALMAATSMLETTACHVTFWSEHEGEDPRYRPDDVEPDVAALFQHSPLIR